MLKLADNLSLPPDAITQTFGFFGRKGSGKTYAAGKLAERMIEAKAQVVVLDPVGNWFGLRLDRTGKHASAFNLPILGGEHGDVPLQPGAGAIIADFVVSTGSSAIIDVSRFRKHERKEFVTIFAEELFHKKKSNRTPMHFIIEEAQVFAPQKTFKGEERMLGALEDIVRLGRNYGIGASMISQRPQSINTELRNQCEPLVVFQLVAKHERDAVGGWMEHMGVDSDLEALSKLQPGECFFWSPAWLDRFIKTRFLEKETFDASATPKVGASTHEPKKLAPVDLQALEISMKDTIEKAKADDPKELKKKIADLERQLKARPAAAPEVVKEPVEVKVPVIDEGELQKFEAILKNISDGNKRTIDSIEGLTNYIRQVRETVSQFKPIVSPNRPIVSHNRQIVSQKPQTVSHSGKANGSANSYLPPAKQKILNGLAFLEGIGVGTADKTQLALLVGVSPTSGGYFNNLGALRSDNLIEYPSGGTVMLTDAGRAVASTDGVPSNTAELHQSLSSRLPPAKWRILEALIDAYPDAIQKDALAEHIGVSPTSGGYFNNLGSLRSLGLIDYPQPGTAKAQRVLFLE